VQLAPNLLSLAGCGVLTAAKLIAETAGVARFRSEACFAMHAGVAPIPASSGRTDRHRLCRGGNRQLNAAIHRIAITQLRLAGPGQIYYRRRRAQATAPVTPSAYSSDASPARSTSSSS
jgi:transposase